MTRAPLLALATLVAGCGPYGLVNLAAEAPLATPLSPDLPLEIKTSSVHVRDPLRISGSNVRVGSLEEPLGHAVASAAAPWAEAHRGDRPGGWQLTVELIQAEAERDDARVIVTIGVRATLRARATNQYLAQSQAHCREAGLVAPARAAPLFYACMTDVAQKLSSWLGGATP